MSQYPGDTSQLVHNWKATPMDCPRCQSSTYFLYGERPGHNDWIICCADDFDEDCQFGASYSLLECEAMLIAEKAGRCAT